MIKNFSIKKNKLTLNTPYKTLYNQLWEQKKKVAEAQISNVILKTKLMNYQKNSRIKENYKIIHTKFQQQKQQYLNILKDINLKKQWIKNTNCKIGQKQYQNLIEQVRKIQEKIIKINNKVKKSQKVLKKKQSNIYQRKDIINQDSNYDIEINNIQEQNDSLKFQILEKQRYLQKQDRQIKILNKNIIKLLNIKNNLKN